MQQNVKAECPKCSRPLAQFNGHIGYCSQHKWVSPAGLGFDAEAAEQNRQDAAAAEKSRLEAERERKAAEEHVRREEHRRSVRNAAAVVVALLMVAAAVTFFVIRPSLNYSGAGETFAAGEYEAALEAYTALGDYKDSAARATLCSAMLDIAAGGHEAALAKLEQLTGEGQGDAARQLADALLPVVENWQEKGLTPQVLLMLLGKADVIDPEGRLDVAALRVDGHIGLLDGTQLAARAEDVDADGSDELVVLEQDYTVTVYRMAERENTRVAVDNDVAAACAMTFGGTYAGTDADAAIACYGEAYRLAPDGAARAALTGAYQARAALHENAGDMDAAIADARSAVEISGEADAFAFFYDVNLRSCRNGHDTATAVAMWEAFAAEETAQLTHFDAKARWDADAAQLHIANAGQLAAAKDEACIDQLRAASALGADVTQALETVKAHFGPGFTLARLRLVEMEVCAGDEAKVLEVHADMSAEIRTAIAEWKERGMAAEDVPALIFFADQQGVDLSGIDRDALYEEAALAAASSVAQSAFVNWNQDAYKELLTLDAQGVFRLYAADGTWDVAAQLDTGLPGCAFTIADEAAPLILVTSQNADELLALTGTENSLSEILRETGICRYAQDGAKVTFSRLMEGSIARYHDYSYEAVGVENRPVRTGLDWQADAYPQPENAAAAVLRYLEARAYGVAEEAQLLITGEAEPTFDLTALDALPAPDAPVTADVAAYYVGESASLFEIAYSAKGQMVRAFVAARNDDGFKVAGAADTYGAGMDAAAADYSVALTGFNEETTGAIAAKGEKVTYRLLAPKAGRLSLVWQSGEKASSRVSHAVTMQRGSLTGETVFSYELQPSLNKQMSRDMLIAPGVYYVTVEARIANAAGYSLTLQLAPEANIELEGNDTPDTATAMALDTAYSAMLSDAKDVDFFAFTLDAPSAVNVGFTGAGSGSNALAYAMTVYSAADGAAVGAAVGGVSVPGSAKAAQTGNLYLAEGVYYAEVKKASAFVGDEYAVTVTAAAGGTMESERNNTPDTADAIAVNEDVRGSFAIAGDVDCFAFTLQNDAVIQPRFSFNPTGEGSKTYVLTVLDAQGTERLKVNIGGKESAKAIIPAALEAGDYIVRIENPRFVCQDYTLNVACMDVAAVEMEPNDSAGLAAPLAVGAPRTGILSSPEDTDYYKVVFDEQTTITLGFSFAKSTAADNAFVITVEQNSKALWKANIKGDSGTLAQQLQFPAGEYYIRVTPSAWLGAVYTIEIN